MPFANVATGGFTNSAGVFTGTDRHAPRRSTASTSRIIDSCGSISQGRRRHRRSSPSAPRPAPTARRRASAAPATPTPPAPSSTMVNRAKEIGRGWLPANTWLNAQLTANVNLNQTCNAFWNGSTINFFRSGGGCGNTGELAGRLAPRVRPRPRLATTATAPRPTTAPARPTATSPPPSPPTTPASAPASSAATAAATATPAPRCTGVRDIDWAKHTSNTPHTVSQLHPDHAAPPAPQPELRAAPCGRGRPLRVATSPPRRCGTSPTATCRAPAPARPGRSPTGSGTCRARPRPAAFTCTRDAAPGPRTAATPARCGRPCAPSTTTTATWPTARRTAAPSFAAFNRHGIACTTDAGCQHHASRGCTPPAAPALTAHRRQQLGRRSRGAARRGVYDVYRNETGCNAGFIKVANDVAGTSLHRHRGRQRLHLLLPGGRPAVAATRPAASAPVDLPVGDPGRRHLHAAGGADRRRRQRDRRRPQINLSWAAVVGRHLVHDLRARPPSGGPYTSVGTSATHLVLEHRPHLQHDLLLRRVRFQRHLRVGQLGPGLGHHRGLHRRRPRAHERRAGHRHLRRHRQPAVLDDERALGRRPTCSSRSRAAPATPTCTSASAPRRRRRPTTAVRT